MNDVDSVVLSVRAEARRLVAPDYAVLDGLDTLDDLSGVLAAHPSLNVHGVMWHVDWDNLAWPQVRAAAVGAAIGKARDYAAALGATVRHVEHVADTGLLGGDTAPS